MLGTKLCGFEADVNVSVPVFTLAIKRFDRFVMIFSTFMYSDSIVSLVCVFPGNSAPSLFYCRNKLLFSLYSPTFTNVLLGPLCQHQPCLRHFIHKECCTDQRGETEFGKNRSCAFDGSSVDFNS